MSEIHLKRYSDWEEMRFLGQKMTKLWQLPPIQATFDKRGAIVGFPDNMDYFFNSVDNIMTKEYVPTQEDYLKMRARTIG